MGPAHRSENNKHLSGTSSPKDLSFLPLIGIGVLFGVVFTLVLLSGLKFAGGDVVLGEDGRGPLVTGEPKDFNGVGKIPVPDWKVLQLIFLKSEDGEELNRAGSCDLDLL